jgi:ribosome-binding ATPase YchF (GTP1/OBG family)
LGHIRGVEVICHVVRCFEDPQIVHVENTVDPLRVRQCAAHAVPPARR